MTKMLQKYCYNKVQHLKEVAESKFTSQYNQPEQYIPAFHKPQYLLSTTCSGNQERDLENNVCFTLGNPVCSRIGPVPHNNVPVMTEHNYRVKSVGNRHETKPAD